jgi:hypothetical protein
VIGPSENRPGATNVKSLFATGEGTSVMSHMSTAILSAIAASATFGAVQFASGHDLTSGLRAFSSAPQEAFSAVLQEGVNAGINRAAKADRVANVAIAHVPTQTISIHVDRVADTSVLVRMPRPQEARNPLPARAPALIKSEDQKATVACEPTVSVLTDIAKRMLPGRCVT